MMLISRKSQGGAVLLVSLVMLLVLTVLAVSSMRGVTLESRITANRAHDMKSQNIADAALREADTTFKDFFVKGRKITGTKTMTTVSITAEGQPVFKVEANLEMLNKKGMAATRIMTGTKTWKSGFGDEDRFNDVFAVEGTATLQRENDLMTRTITSPLIVDRSCDFIKEGRIDLDKNGTISTIDFGDGTCDAIATVTKDSDTYEIDLEEERVDRRKGKCNKGDHADVVQADN